MKLLYVIITLFVITAAGLMWVASEPENIMQQIYFAVKCATTMIWIYTVHSVWSRYDNSRTKS